MKGRTTPPTNAIAMARWAWHDIAGLRVTMSSTQCGFWEVCDASEKSISRRWDEEHNAMYPREGQKSSGLLTQRRADLWGDALFAWRDATMMRERYLWGITCPTEYSEFSRLKNHLTIAGLSLLGDALHQAIAGMLLSWLNKREGTTWEDVTATVLIHGSKSEKEAVILGALPRTEALEAA